jgi:hypothetical protein
MENNIVKLKVVSENTSVEKEQQKTEEVKAVEEKTIEENKTIDESPAKPLDADVEIDESKVLTFIKTKYNKEISAIDELFAEKETLPEDVAAFHKFKKETGRGIDDFLLAQKDYSTLSEEDRLKEYLKHTNQGLDDSYIDIMFEEYVYDEDLDDEKYINQVKLKKAKALSEADKYLQELQGKYRVPLESKESPIPSQDLEELERYRQAINEAKTEQEANAKKAELFSKKTDELFSSEFKGFEFSIDDKKYVVPFGNPNELKQAQSSAANFIKKFLDENGMIKDAVGYHRGLATAMNPDKVAKYFYDLGKAEAVEELDKGVKNINMSTKSAPTQTRKDGVKLRVLDSDKGSGLKVRI